MVAAKKEWLVRDTSNFISGPYTRDEILQQVRSQRVRGKAEICLANKYWFTTDERQELINFFPELAKAGEQSQSQLTASVATHSVMHTEKQAEALEKAQSEQTAMISGFNAPTAAPAGDQRAALTEWLSDEYADEFGVQLEESSNQVASAIHVAAKTAAAPKTLADEPALPDFQIPAKQAAQRAEAAPEPKTKWIWVILGAVLLALLGFGGVLVIKKGVMQKAPVQKKSEEAPVDDGLPKNAIDRLSLSLLMGDVKLLLATQAEMEMNEKGNPMVPLAAALGKGNFRFDADGAAASLEMAKGLSADNKKLLAEIENLQGIYTIAASPKEAVAKFQAALNTAPGIPVFKFNLALANAFAGNASMAAQLAAELSKELSASAAPLLYEAGLLQGMALELSKSDDERAIEEAYQQALVAGNPGSEAKLSLGVYKLRQQNVDQARVQLEDFLNDVPELDSLGIVVNYRLAKNSRLLTHNIASLRASHNLARNYSDRLESTVLAVDAFLAGMQNEFLESAKILDNALGIFPGDSNLLIALATLKYREQKYDVLITLLQDKSREGREFFPFLKLLGFAYMHLDRLALAEQNLMRAARADGAHSEIWSMLGELYQRKGDEAQAKQMFKTALDRNPRDLRAVIGLIKGGDRSLLSKPLYRDNLPF